MLKLPLDNQKKCCIIQFVVKKKGKMRTYKNLKELTERVKKVVKDDETMDIKNSRTSDTKKTLYMQKFENHRSIMVYVQKISYGSIEDFPVTEIYLNELEEDYYVIAKALDNLAKLI